MPLDSTGEFGLQGLSNNRALLILPNHIEEHRTHLCLAGLWVNAATQILAKRLSIDPQQVYVVAKREVTTGHLLNYTGRTMVLGLERNPGPPPPNDEMSLRGNILREVYHGNTIHTPYEMPDTVERMISESRPFYFLGARPSGLAAHGLVDCAQSAARNALILTDFRIAVLTL